MVQGVTSLTHNWVIVSLNPIKGSHCFLGKETVSTFLSTGWLREQI